MIVNMRINKEDHILVKHLYRFKGYTA